MRKAIIAAIVATALFAVGAFAASFTLRAEDVASGSNPVSSCATSVDVDFAKSPNANVGGTWPITGATVTFLSSGGPATTCEPFNASLALDIDTDDLDTTVNDTVEVLDQPINSSGSPVSAVTAVFDLRSLNITADQIVNASVLVDGNYLDAPL